MKTLKAVTLAVVLFLAQVIYINVGYPLSVSAQPVGAENIPPFVEVLPDVSSGKAPLFVRFECNAWDEDGEIAKVEWDLEGDGVFERAKSVRELKGAEKASALKEALRGEKTFLKPGIFHILTKVTDDKDSSSVSSVTIKVYSDTPFLDVIPCDREGFAYMARSGYEALFTGWMGEGSVQFEMGEAIISYEFKDQTFGKVNKAKGVAEGNVIWYYNVYENVDVRYTVYEDLLLEELILRTPLNISVVEQSFTVRNVEYRMEDDGSIGFYNGESLVFTIPKPVMYELNNPERKSYGLHYEIAESEHGYILRKIIDDVKWLQTATYPVVIDSSTQGEIADPWEQQGLTTYGQYFKNFGEYVDPMTGHLVIRHTDYSLPGRGLDVNVTRVYSTVVAYRENEDGSGEYIPVATYVKAPTDLGCGWSLDLPWLETQGGTSKKYLHLPNGVQVKTDFQNGVWNNGIYHFMMCKNGDNTYTKYRDDGIREDYDTQGRITSITDLNGNTITFTYAIVWYGETEPKYGLTQVRDTVGRVITFTYSLGKLVSISDGVRTTTYSYSGDKLVAVTDPLGRVTTYDYMDANSFLITGVHYPTGGFSSYEYAAFVPEAAKLAPYKSSVTENGVPTYYVYKVDSPDTVSWTSPALLNSMTAYAARPYVLQRDDGSLVMYYKDTYVWTEKVWKCEDGDCWWETIIHTEYWIKRSVSTDQQHWSTPEMVVQVKSTTGNPVVIEKRDGSLAMYYKDTNTAVDYWIYRRASSDGLTWGSAVKFQQTTLSVRNVAAIQKIDTNFLLCYTDKVGSLYYLRQMTSTDGITWSSPSNTLQVDSNTGNPTLGQKNTGEIYLAYRKGGNIYLLTNTGGGWSSPVQTTAVAVNDPCLLITDEIVLIYKGTDNHFYRISSANGSTWSSPIQIAPNPVFTDPSSVYRKDRFYRVTTQYISESLLNTVRITDFSYNGDYKLSSSSDVVIRDGQTIHSSMHFEYGSGGVVTERITKDEQGIQTERIVYTYNSNNEPVQQSVYRGTSQEISFTVTTGRDNWGNVIYSKDPEGAEHFYSYENTSYQNQFVDSKGSPIALFSNAFYTNSVPANCHILLVGEAFINSGKVRETYYKYDPKGNVTETKVLFPTRDYSVFSGVFSEPSQTSFIVDLTGLTMANGILVISAIPVPTQETLHETHSEPGKGWHNTGTWNGESFLADYTHCFTVPEPDCFDGQTEIGPFDHYPGSPNYTGYTTWVEDDHWQYVQTNYTAIVDEYPAKVEYNLNGTSWTVITNSLGAGTTSVTVSADKFIQGVNTLQFRESNSYFTKFSWALYLNQGSTPQEYITSYSCDSYGNMISSTNAKGHTTAYTYSSLYQYAYLTSKMNVVDGQIITVSATYDFQTGNITSRACACGSVTDYEYDALGRLTKVIHPLTVGEQVRAEYEIIYDDTENTVTSINEDNEKTVKYYDGLDRMCKTETYRNDVVWAEWLYEYNYIGKPIRATDPLGRVYQCEYDALGRVTRIINPDYTFRTLEYDDEANTATLTDENGHTRVFSFTLNGNLSSVREFNSASSYLTEYEYDQEGNLIFTRDSEGNVITFAYNSIFGVTDCSYPDSTEQHFSYDNIGNLIEKVDQNGNHITYEYDAISRLTHVNYGDTSVSFTHDLAGNRTSMVTSDVTTLYVYDARNRVTQKTTVIGGESYPISYVYDPASNVTAITYPDSTTVEHTYFFSQVETISGYASFSYFPDGSLEHISQANGVTTDFTYDTRGRMHTLDAHTGDDLLDLTYSYDDVGNITGIQNNFLTASSEWITSAEVCVYDDLDRLISASGTFGTLSYSYDSRRRLSATENGQTTPYVYNYDFLISAGDESFTYDLNGNTLSKSAESQWAYHYDKANRLTQVEEDDQTIGQYVYDGDGKRVKKTEWSEDLQEYRTTIYVYSGTDVLYEETASGTATYVYGPSGRLAKRTAINSETNTFYYTKDHIGSTRMVTDENGTPLTSATYSPFGSLSEFSGFAEPYLFTGKEQDLTGLYYFGARYYDPQIGRFLTRDPYTFLPDDPKAVGTPAKNCTKRLFDPQKFERYTYARNNPLRYTDLWGERVCENPGSGECDEAPKPVEPHPTPTPPSTPDTPKTDGDSDGDDDDDDDDDDSNEAPDCDECKCMEDPVVKELVKSMRELFWSSLGEGVAIGILCVLAGLGAGVAAAVSAGAASALVFWIGVACVGITAEIATAAWMESARIARMMIEAGCPCAVYCSGPV